QLVDPVAPACPDRQRVQVQAAGLEGVVGQDQVVAALARNDVPVAGRDCQPALVVDGDRGLALEHNNPGPLMSVFGRTSAQENHESPGFPTSRHLMGAPQGCQQLLAQFSPMASMTCATLERIVQALSTSN